MSAFKEDVEEEALDGYSLRHQPKPRTQLSSLITELSSVLLLPLALIEGTRRIGERVSERQRIKPELVQRARWGTLIIPEPRGCNIEKRTLRSNLLFQSMLKLHTTKGYKRVDLSRNTSMKPCRSINKVTYLLFWWSDQFQIKHTHLSVNISQNRIEFISYDHITQLMLKTPSLKMTKPLQVSS